MELEYQYDKEDLTTDIIHEGFRIALKCALKPNGSINYRNKSLIDQLINDFNYTADEIFRQLLPKFTHKFFNSVFLVDNKTHIERYERRKGVGFITFMCNKLYSMLRTEVDGLVRHKKKSYDKDKYGVRDSELSSLMLDDEDSSGLPSYIERRVIDPAPNPEDLMVYNELTTLCKENLTDTQYRYLVGDITSVRDAAEFEKKSKSQFNRDYSDRLLLLQKILAVHGYTDPSLIKNN